MRYYYVLLSDTTMCLDIYWLLEKTKAKKPSCAGGNRALAGDKAFIFYFMFLTTMTKKKRIKKGKRRSAT